MWRSANVLFTGVFLLAAAVQYNDPDPIRWSLMYLSAAAACGIAVAGKLHWVVPAAIGALAVCWALTLVRAVSVLVGADGLFGRWGMKSVRVEEGRELFGLLIVAGWMGVLAAHRWRAGARKRTWS